MMAYRRSPLSFVLFLLLSLSALFTMAVLLVLIVSILIKGLPHLTPE